MHTKCVKDLMLRLEDYAIVDEEDTLYDAVIALEKAQAKVPEGRMKHRAVLVRNKDSKIVGKLGHLAFLKALEPKYSSLGDLRTLSRAGLSTEFVNSMMDTYRFWGYKLADIRQRARSTKIKDVLHPVTENIDENAPLSEAIHKFVMWQTLSILVKRNDEIVGILRLSDLFNEMERVIKESNSIDQKNEA